MNQKPSTVTPRICIVDTTLRDGEQTPGVAFSAVQKRRIASQLSGMGVGELEIGTPAMGSGEQAAIRSVVRLGLPCRLTAWCRARQDDIDAARQCEVDAVHLSIPSSDIHLNALGKDRDWALSRIGRLVVQARQWCDFVSVGAMDASRAEPGFLIECARLARNAGASRFRLADTVGIWSPTQVYRLVSRIHAAVVQDGFILGFHGHNDLGMATANTLSAVMAGAASVDVTVNGLGERAGNAALEEVVMALLHTQSMAVGIDTRSLRKMAILIAECSGIPIAPLKPIVGAHAFRHESGIHVRGLLADRRTFEPFAPEMVGVPGREIVLGKHSGSTAIKYVLTAD